MSFWASLEQGIAHAFSTTEADVIAIVKDVISGVEVAASDIDKALQWVAGHAPAIAANVQGVTSLLSTVATVAAPLAPAVSAEIDGAVAAANLAVEGLNAVASSIKTSGGGTVATDANAVLAGYHAVKTAQAASAKAAAAVVAAGATVAQQASAPAAPVSSH